MKGDTHDLKNGSLFPWHLKVLAVCMVIGAIALFLTNILLALVLLFIALLILTGYSGVLINKSENTYKEYNSFIFMKRGIAKKFEAVEKIFINENRVSQKIYTAHTLNSSTFKNLIYDGYLKFIDGEKVHLMSKKDKNVLMSKLKETAEFLEVEVYDNTQQA